MVAFFALFVPDAKADAALDRASAYHRAHPIFETDFGVSIGRDAAKGHIVFDHDRRLAGRFNATDIQYRFSYTPDGDLEVNDARKLYDEYPGRPQVHLYPSRISHFTGAIPAWLMAPDFRANFPQGTAFAFTGTETDFGLTCDVAHTKISNAQGTINIDAAIDPAGRVRRLKAVTEGATRTVIEWHFTKVDPIEHPTSALFALNAPLGFVPFALPLAIGPEPTGSAFPTAGWRASAGGALNIAARLGGKGALVAILAGDSEPCVRARVSLARLKSGVPVVTLANVSHPLPNTDGYDPDGIALAKVSVPDTPLFLLVNAKGKIVSEWMGFDPEHAASFERDVRKAYNGS